MAKASVATRIAGEISAALPHLVRFPLGNASIDYDASADVLYISFRRPQKATNTVEKDGILFRYRGRALVGVTILNAAQRAASETGRSSRRIRPAGGKPQRMRSASRKVGATA